ncbi:flavodoxin reductase [Cellulophaga sp. F20128]|uniref:flavodoxin reductase n=1 Tax=Cellulophaga sp. F20128 TaxID=2926413 RepID=UPI001FF1670B|nr:flavodoxin reductase [Cellulophaga sp. F20128]MCK0157251.1 flavodoxin reductase [Cellulophaga sp. F20128]
MKIKPVKIISIGFNTHDVLHIVTAKPKGIEFVPGQATEIFIDKEGWYNQGRAFTFTCLPTDDYLEFLIKIYPSHKGVTNRLLDLKAGDKLIINDVFGAITYNGEGTFIAGGTGITPFISIFRELKAHNKLGNNRLIYANKTKKDIILENEFKEMLGDNFINILSEEKIEGYSYGRVSKNFIKNNSNVSNSIFYVCGPPHMMLAVEKYLLQLGVSKKNIVTEEF